MTHTATVSAFTIGSVFSRSWRVFTGNLPTFIFLSLLIYAPLLVLILLVATLPAGLVTISVIVGLVTMILNFVVWAVIIHAAFQCLRSQPVRIGASFSFAWSRIIPVIILAIAQSILIALGLALLVVPGIFLIIVLFVSMPCCVVERLDPFASMGRSSDLTKGYRWQLLGIIVLIMIVSVVVALLLAGILGHGSLALDLVNWVWNILFAAFMSVLAVVTYHDLRVVKEGVDVEKIAAMFE